MKTIWGTGTWNFGTLIDKGVSSGSATGTIQKASIENIVNQAISTPYARVTEATITASMYASLVGRSYTISVAGTSVKSGSLSTDAERYTADISTYFWNGGETVAFAGDITIKIGSGLSSKHCDNVTLGWRYEYDTYSITVNSNGNGTVAGSNDNCLYNSQVTITATPNAGYKFVKWSDGNTSATRTITVTADATYTAEFTKNVYVTYDSIFSFAKWKDTGITAGNGAVSDITNIGFTLTSNAGVSEATCSSHYFPVEYGKSYKIDIDIVGNNWDVYIFFCDKDGNWIDFADSTNRFSSNGSGVSSRVFTAPNNSSVVKAQIRVDANGANNKVSFSNFRIFPAEYEYMSNTVSAEERDDFNTWSQPTPTRQWWEFFGWYSTPTGGQDYTPGHGSFDFPTEDLTLYSVWSDKSNDGGSKLYVGTSNVGAAGVLNNTIYFRIRGTITKDISHADTVDGYNIEVVNSMPTGATEVNEIYIGTTKVY